MKTQIRVQMTENALFDFMLYHAYSGLAGFLCNIFGLGMLILGALRLATHTSTAFQIVSYFVVGAVILTVTPLLLRLRARTLVRKMKIYSEPIDYFFSDGGMEICQGETKREIKWEQVDRVVATPKTISYYYNKTDAAVIPKEAFGGRFAAVMGTVCRYVPAGKIRVPVR